MRRRIGIAAAIRGKFVYRMTFATAVLALVFNMVQWALLWGLFNDDLAGKPGLSTNLAIIAGVMTALFVTWVLLTYATSRRFMLPLGDLVHSVRSACEGTIGQKVSVTSADEFGVLAEAYNQMLDLIVYLIRQTQEASKLLAQSASDILAATEQQAQPAAQQEGEEQCSILTRERST